MPSISIEEYKKLRQQGLTPEQISEQVNQKTTGLIPKVGKFLGMEEFGKGLGQLAFGLTKEKRDLDKLLDEGRISPEEYESITTGGLTNREVIGSAAQTALTTVGLRGGLPSQLGAKPILGKIAAGAVTGAGFGGAESFKEGRGVVPGAITGGVVGGVMGGLIGVASKALQNIGNKKASEYLVAKTLKQSQKDLAMEQAGKRPVLAKQFMESGLKGSEEKIVEDSAKNLVNLEKQLQDTLTRNKNTSINTVKLIRSADELVKQKRNVFGESGVKVINEYKKFLQSKGDKIPVIEAHKYVRDIYKELGDAAFNKDVLPVNKSLLKTIASAARREIGTSVPAADKILKQEQFYIRVLDNLEKQLRTQKRINVVGLSDSILAAGGIGAGNPVLGIGAGVLKRSVESAQFKTRTAVKLSQLGDLINKIPTDSAGRISKTALFNLIKEVQP